MAGLPAPDRGPAYLGLGPDERAPGHRTMRLLALFLCLVALSPRSGGPALSEGREILAAGPAPGVSPDPGLVGDHLAGLRGL